MRYGTATGMSWGSVWSMNAAIDIQRSGTRREELLLGEQDLRQVWTMRRMVSMLGGSEGTELMLGRLSKTASNSEFLATLSKDL